MRSTLLAVAALAFLRIVVGLHFFLEGMSHLRDPDWSSAGFRRAAVGPLADWYRAGLPQTGDWSGTLAARDQRSATEAGDAWKASIVAGWKKLLADRGRAVPLDAPRAAEAEKAATALSANIAPEKRPPPAMFSAHIWAMSHGVVELFTRGPPGARSPFAPEDLLEAGIGIYLRGLGLLPPDR